MCIVHLRVDREASDIKHVVIGHHLFPYEKEVTLVYGRSSLLV
jgi:hypothetical protein